MPEDRPKEEKKLQYQPADLGVYVAEPGEIINTTANSCEEKYHGKICLSENGIWICPPDGKSIVGIANVYTYSEEQKNTLREIFQAISNHFGQGVKVKQFKSPEERVADMFEEVLGRMSKGLPSEELGKTYGSPPIDPGTRPAPKTPFSTPIQLPETEFIHKNPPMNDFTRNVLALKAEFSADDVMKIVQLSGDELSKKDDDPDN
jgi:hypothetical protein